MGAGDCDGCDGCGFCAKDAGAEGYRLPSMLGKERYLFRGPAAFRADGDGVGDWMVCGRFGDGGFESGSEGGGLFGFA